MGRRGGAPTGRYSCIAQGASPGLINGTHLLNPKGAALLGRKTNARVIVPLLIGAHIICCLCLPRVLYRALPSLHPGLCRSGVPTALIMRLDFDALALHLIERSYDKHELIVSLRNTLGTLR